MKFRKQVLGLFGLGLAARLGAAPWPLASLDFEGQGFLSQDPVAIRRTLQDLVQTSLPSGGAGLRARFVSTTRSQPLRLELHLEKPRDLPALETLELEFRLRSWAAFLGPKKARAPKLEPQSFRARLAPQALAKVFGPRVQVRFLEPRLRRASIALQGSAAPKPSPLSLPLSFRGSLGPPLFRRSQGEASLSLGPGGEPQLRVQKLQQGSGLDSKLETLYERFLGERLRRGLRALEEEYAARLLFREVKAKGPWIEVSGDWVSELLPSLARLEALAARENFQPGFLLHPLR